MAPTQSPLPTLVAIRAAHHAEITPQYDRVVFAFSGALPLIQVEYVQQILSDGSGVPIPIAGKALLRVQLTPARAHDDKGQSTVPDKLNCNLPNLKQVVSAGDFEGVVTYGIGLDHKADIRIVTLNNPSRLVIDIF